MPAAALAWTSIAFGTVLSAIVVYVVVQRFRFPVQLEWMSGGVYDHVARVREGKALYTEPSASYVPFIYPPLLYWACAPFASALGSEVGCRVVPVACSIVIATMAAAIARTLGASRKHAALALLLYVAAYPFSGYWYDLERADSLMLGLLAVATLLLLRGRQAVSALAAGALCGVALFAKQPAILFVGAFAVGLATLRSFVRLGAFLGGFLAVFVPLFTYLQSTSGGWFAYYCWKMPSMHGIRSELIPLFFLTDASKVVAMVAGTFAWLFYVMRIAIAPLHVRQRERVSRTLLFGCALAAGYVSAMSGRLHAGGYLNVLMFWTFFAGIALAVSASASKSLWVKAAPLLAFMQFGFDPNDAAPTGQRVTDARIVEARVRELEKQGDVIVHGRGGLTQQRHFHIMGLADVLRAGRGVPDDLRDGLERRAYAAYVINEPGELYLDGILFRKSELGDLILSNYYVGERLDDREPPPLVGWIAHPSWVFLPRKKPKAPLSRDELWRRLTVELGLAEARMRQKQAGLKDTGDSSSIESEAEAILARMPHAP